MLFKELKIIRLPDLTAQELQQLGYKVAQKQLPDPLINLFNVRGDRKTHRYETRGKNIPNIQAHSNTQFNQSFLCKCLSLYHKLPMVIKQSPSLKNFTKKLKDRNIY